VNRPHGCIGRTISVLLTACAVIGSASPACRAQVRDEREVRSAYVFNLVKYVEWPAGNSNILIGYIGEGETGAVMQTMLSGRNFDSHTIRFVAMPSEEDLAKCSAVYVAATSDAETRRLLDRLKTINGAMLTIGETESFLRAGGAVALVRVDDHIQIEVNLDAAQRAGVRISSRLLSLATIVRSARNAGN
jgi:hypothetical protein